MNTRLRSRLLSQLITGFLLLAGPAVRSVPPARGPIPPPDLAPPLAPRSGGEGTD